MAERAGEGIQGRGATLKRRGILAAAGAVVAGLMAKRAAEEAPVAANDATWTFPYSGSTSYTGDAFRAQNSGTGRGIYGSSAGNHGVFGDLGAVSGSGYAGVFGLGNGDGTYGVYGSGYQGSGVGVLGTSDAATGTGVKGVSSLGFPVIGVALGGANANAGVLGVGTLGPGVQGQSYAGHGLVGTTAAKDGQHAGLIGTVQPGGNGVGLRGSIPAGAAGFAGVFDGDLIVNGALRVYGSPKNAAVKHPTDNSYRLLYCMESPESWFEDFGRAIFVNGAADVKLDPDFAALVHADDYHVFLTEYDTHHHLSVTRQTPAGFAVTADVEGAAAKGKKPADLNGTFSYRVVAKRKDIAGERLAKVAPPPPLKPVTPFAVPETPEAKPPAKKP